LGGEFGVWEILLAQLERMRRVLGQESGIIGVG
jgi:hypothetical protein